MVPDMQSRPDLWRPAQEYPQLGGLVPAMRPFCCELMTSPWLFSKYPILLYGKKMSYQLILFSTRMGKLPGPHGFFTERWAGSLLKGYGVLGEEGGISFPVTHVKKWPFFGHRASWPLNFRWICSLLHDCLDQWGADHRFLKASGCEIVEGLSPRVGFSLVVGVLKPSEPGKDKKPLSSFTSHCVPSPANRNELEARLSSKEN